MGLTSSLRVIIRVTVAVLNNLVKSSAGTAGIQAYFAIASEFAWTYQNREETEPICKVFRTSVAVEPSSWLKKARKRVTSTVNCKVHTETAISKSSERTCPTCFFQTRLISLLRVSGYASAFTLAPLNGKSRHKGSVENKCSKFGSQSLCFCLVSCCFLGQSSRKYIAAIPKYKAVTLMV